VVRGSTDAEILPSWVRMVLVASEVMNPALGNIADFDASQVTGSRSGPTVAMEVQAPIDDGGYAPGGVTVVVSGHPASVPIPGLAPPETAAVSIVAAHVAELVRPLSQATVGSQIAELYPGAVRWPSASVAFMVADEVRSCPAAARAVCTADQSWAGALLLRGNRTAGDETVGESPVLGVRLQGLIEGWNYSATAAVASSSLRLRSELRAAGNFSASKLSFYVPPASGARSYPEAPTRVSGSSSIGGSLSIRWTCRPETGGGSSVVGFVLLFAPLGRML